MWTLLCPLLKPINQNVALKTSFRLYRVPQNSLPQRRTANAAHRTSCPDSHSRLHLVKAQRYYSPTWLSGRQKVMLSKVVLSLQAS